jgi:hypothetical protein
MSADDTAKNRSRQVKGKAKEVAGKAGFGTLPDIRDRPGET